MPPDDNIDKKREPTGSVRISERMIAMTKFMKKLTAVITAAAMTVSMCSLAAFADGGVSAEPVFDVTASWYNYTVVHDYKVSVSGDKQLDGLSGIINDYDEVKVTVYYSANFNGGSSVWTFAPDGSGAYSNKFSINKSLVKLDPSDASVDLISYFTVKATKGGASETVKVGETAGALPLYDSFVLDAGWVGTNNAKINISTSLTAKLFGDDTTLAELNLVTVTADVTEYFKLNNYGSFEGTKNNCTASSLKWVFTPGQWSKIGNGVFFNAAYQGNGFMLNGQLPIFSTTDAEGNVIMNAITVTGTKTDGSEVSAIVSVPTLEFDDVKVEASAEWSGEAGVANATVTISTIDSNVQFAPTIKYNSVNAAYALSDYFTDEDGVLADLTYVPYAAPAVYTERIVLGDKAIDLTNPVIPVMTGVTGAAGQLSGTAADANIAYNTASATIALSQDMIDNGYSFSAEEQVNEKVISFVEGQTPAEMPVVYGPDKNVEDRLVWTVGESEVSASDIVPGDKVLCELNAGKVTFLDRDGNVIAVRYVFEDVPATAPAAPEISGYSFAAWLNGEGGVADLSVYGTYTVIASYTQNVPTYEVTIIPDETTDGGDVIIIPDDETPAGGAGDVIGSGAGVSGGDSITIGDEDSAAGEGAFGAGEASDNPYTGADDFSGVAAAGLVFGLAGAAATVIFKKKK